VRLSDELVIALIFLISKYLISIKDKLIYKPLKRLHSFIEINYVFLFCSYDYSSVLDS